MKNKLAVSLLAALLASCATSPDSSKSGGVVETTADGTSTAPTLHAYKQDLAQRISQVNSRHIYAERPQALLRSIVVLKFSVDGNGNLLGSEIQRSNRDRTAESTALESLKRTTPFPKPAPHLLRHGKVDISESWLFNNDGRFQLRSVALPQMDR
ncbi:TonB family protein [Oxalobacteraceae bacterium R-40]|uniref:TonB family protein n=1 Tax=Keguizhuia sedimenti TaxID=3064264 RepID=A0ABU1BKK3_9BURK|nr:TonB family protein [Oxalobacteraceae bacterium R-40]